MSVESNRNTIVTKYRVPLGDDRATVTRNRTKHRISLARHTDSFEPHDGRTRKYRAATCSFIANTNDAFHFLSLF
jgi:hypothetical protein